MEETPAEVVATPTVDRRYILDQQLKNGASWFYWIAGLSVLNSLIFMFGGNVSFIVGLAITQFVDGFFGAVAAEVNSPALPMIIKGMAIVMDLLVAGVFVAFGYLGRKGYRWAMITGIAIYLLDGVLYLIVADWLPVLFHAWALWSIWTGLKAMNELKKENQGGVAVA
ncbi:MAG TPA: hypothetical protein VFR01_00200, partial [Geobacterales bacterium]|nr:hypothetical protein [Geobacterales bacterium]